MKRAPAAAGATARAIAVVIAAAAGCKGAGKTPDGGGANIGGVGGTAAAGGQGGGDRDGGLGGAPDGGNPQAPQLLRSVAIGVDFTCAIVDDGRVKCWGDNSAGQLGTGRRLDILGDEPGEMGDALPFVRLGTGRTAVSLAAGYRSTCALLDNGQIKCWGFGPLGQGHNDPIGDEPGEMGDALPALSFF